MTEATKNFSTELRRRRQAAGLSLAELAVATHYSKGYLSKVENGVRPANRDLASRCDAALGATGALVAAAGTQATPPPFDEPDDGDAVWVMTMNQDGSGQFVPLSRRQALTAGVSLLTWPARNVGSPAGTDGSTLAVFGSLFGDIRDLGRAVSPAAVLPVAIAQTRALHGLAAASSGPGRDRLLMLAGRHAEYVGWMSQEAGDDRAAMWWTDVALELADAAGDRELQAYALVRKAGVLLYRDDAVSVVALARRAQRHPRVPPRIRGLAARREAQGHALVGDRDQCMRALDRAADLLPADGSATGRLASDQPIDTAPPLGSTSAPDQHALVTGWCLYDLGQPRPGADVLDAAVATIPPTAKRAAARFGVRRALSYAAAGDVDRACTLAADVLDTAALVDSATVRVDLRRLARALSRWHGRPAVRNLQARLGAAYREPGT
jgi:hypothetical protein